MTVTGTVATTVMFWAMAITGAPTAADPLPRIEHVTRALAAVRGLGPTGRDQLDRAIYATARAQCHADTGTPTATCLVAAGLAVCTANPDRPRCEAAADVIVTNLRAAASWVDEATRFRLVRGSADYHAALAGELHRRYATLAVELVLGGRARMIAAPGAATAAATGDATVIDQLCTRRDRAIHACEPGDTACVPSLPWSRCAAALIWFIGGGT